jgi:hypothetical protein
MVKDLIDQFSQYIDFEKIVKQILERNKFSLTENKTKNSFDFSGSIGNSIVYVEIKYYQGKLPKLDLLYKACEKLLSQKDNERAKLLLIVSSYISPVLKQEIFNKDGIIVWDAVALLALAFEFPAIYYELENILIRSFQEPLGDLSVIDRDYKDLLLTTLMTASSSVKRRTSVDKGAKLCEELNDLIPGKIDAIKFENKCIDILKYLFDNKRDLTLWSPQPTSDDGLHRFDLLCRIISSPNTFWNELASDFHTRYVLFEFKNYTDEIKQGQIYSTEKYLFLTALRSVGFIIARNGADANAIKAAKGALKEAGKLIIILTAKDLCDMLKLRDNGDEPSLILRRKIDEILTTLTR